MADGSNRAKLPWGMSKDNLKPNSVQSISQQKLKAFSLGMMNPLKRAAMKKKEEKKMDKKIAEAKETAEVFEQFVASFEDAGQAGKAFVRGSTYNPEKPASMSERSKPGAIYKPSSRFQAAAPEEKPSAFKSPAVNQKPQKKKGTEKKKSILELFREELKRAQEERKDRHTKKDSEDFPAAAVPDVEPGGDLFEVEEYKNINPDSSDKLSTNLYVGNINPKMNEEMLCQMFGKFGPLASVKVMWPRTEEERAKRKNCGFVAFMKREDAEKALENFKGTTIMDYEAQVGWGKAVPLPPQPIYVPPDLKEDEKAKHPDPPSGLPFNAQPVAKKKSGYGNVPPPGLDSRPDRPDFDETLYTALIRVVIPADNKLLRLIHRTIEFVIREGPMFEAMIMNREINNPMFKFLFDNRCPSHLYYRWKLFSILQGDSPETWQTAEFRMFENGSLWKPPPLKNLRMKMLPPVEKDTILQRGQLSSSNRDELEDQLRHLTMERASIRRSMVWCLDHADSAEEVVDCICEALTIETTPLPKKLARLFLVSDILHNCSSAVRYSSNYRRGFEGKLVGIFEHFGTIFQGITSRMRSENFKRRILACVNSWDLVSIYHFNLLDKLKETFFGRTQEEMEKQKAFDTVAALMATSDKEAVGKLDGVPLFDDRPIDFSGTGYNEDIDGEPLEEDIDGVPMAAAQDTAKAYKEELDGEPLESPPIAAAAPVVKSKWELVDYDTDEEDGGKESDKITEKLTEKQKMQAQLEERQRQIKRDVEVKVEELSAVLERSGSYNKTDIKQRLEKYREKLMKEAVVPKMTPPSSPTHRKQSHSRSPSPSTLAKYDLDDSPEDANKGSSPVLSPRRKRSLSPEVDRRSPRSPPPKRRKSSTERKRSRSPRKRSRSRSPRKRSRSRSPRKRSRSRSPRKRSRSRSPRKRSRSRSPRKRSRSRSPRKRSRSRSPRKRSRSRSPRRRSRSPRRRRSSSTGRRRSRSPRSRKRSRSPKRSRHRSRSPKSHRHRSRSKSPARSSKRKRRSRSRSHSPQKSSKKSTKH